MNAHMKRMARIATAMADETLNRLLEEFPVDNNPTRLLLERELDRREREALRRETLAVEEDRASAE